MKTRDCYNSIESQKTYLGKNKLFNVEKSIFDMFNFNKNIKILDLGCGGGRTTIALLEKGFENIIAIDYADNLIKGAKKQFPEYQDYFKLGDATNMIEFKDNTFDIVFFSYNGIDYIQGRKERLKAYSEISRVLKRGGLFIFSSHNRLCLPTNRNLLKTHLKNIFRLNNEYWYTKQSFGNIKTYYSNPYKLEDD